MSAEFAEVASSISKASDLVREISAASLEQAQGVELINKAVGGVDKVVQENASNAEEAASTSSQLKAQADNMTRFVNRLISLIEGCEKEAKEASGGPAPREPVENSQANPNPLGHRNTPVRTQIAA
jgi:methyl-accepting chemotaxis protein